MTRIAYIGIVRVVSPNEILSSWEGDIGIFIHSQSNRANPFLIMSIKNTYSYSCDSYVHKS